MNIREEDHQVGDSSSRPSTCIMQVDQRLIVTYTQEAAVCLRRVLIFDYPSISLENETNILFKSCLKL